jgi:hypothetical protein
MMINIKHKEYITVSHFFFFDRLDRVILRLGTNGLPTLVVAARYRYICNSIRCDAIASHLCSKAVKED